MSEKINVKRPFYFSYFEKLYETWENSASQALRLWFKNPIFVNCMEKALEKSLEFKNYTQDIIEKTLNYRHTPIKNNMYNLMNKIDDKEIKFIEKDKKIKQLKTHNKTKKPKNQERRNPRRKKQ